MNVPRQYEVVVTTPSFRRGQSAAWRDFEKDPDSVPNRDLLTQLVDREFAAGYVDEWENFCVPMRAVTAQREEERKTYPACGRCGEIAHSGLCWFDPR